MPRELTQLRRPSGDGSKAHLLAASITAGMRSEPTMRSRILTALKSLLSTRNHISTTGSDVVTLGRAFSFFSQSLDSLVAQGLQQSIDCTERLTAIRSFFLEPRPTYSIDELASLWNIETNDVRDLYSDLLSETHPTGKAAIEWADALGACTLFGIFRPIEIERALGVEFGRLWSEDWRTEPVLLHLPQYVREALLQEAVLPQTRTLEGRIEQLLLER